MGLDSVEFVMAIEEAFGLDVPDADAAQLLTPRMLIDYLWGRLPPSDEEGCLSQRAFYFRHHARRKRRPPPESR